MYLDVLFNDCFKHYENEIKILQHDPASVVDQADPQSVLDKMKENSLSKVCAHKLIN